PGGILIQISRFPTSVLRQTGQGTSLVRMLRNPDEGVNGACLAHHKFFHDFRYAKLLQERLPELLDEEEGRKVRRRRPHAYCGGPPRPPLGVLRVRRPLEPVHDGLRVLWVPRVDDGIPVRAPAGGPEYG